MSLGEPSVFINKMYTAPLSFPPDASSLFAPTAKSLTPSPSRSPMFATESPKRKLSFNENPKLSSVSSLISTVEHKNNFQELLGMCLSVLQIFS